MGRPIFPYELEDPDFSWLISKYREENPICSAVEAACLPYILLPGEDKASFQRDIVPVDQQAAEAPVANEEEAQTGAPREGDLGVKR